MSKKKLAVSDMIIESSAATGAFLTCPLCPRWAAGVQGQSIRIVRIVGKRHIEAVHTTK